MPSAGSLVYLLVGLNSLIQSSTIHVEALLSLCVGQFSHVLSLPVCRCYSFIEPLQNCFSCNLLLPVGHSKNPEKRSLRFRTPEWPERYNWACSVGWPDLNILTAWMGAFNAVCFRIGCIFVLALYWEMAAFPTLWALPLFHFVPVPKFGASPPGSPSQSRDHTLLPKRPRMPAKRFIGSDWPTGRGGG